MLEVLASGAAGSILVALVLVAVFGVWLVARRGRLIVEAWSVYDWATHEADVAAWNRYCLDHCGIAEIDAMSGVGFEERLAILFTELGYDCYATRASGDFGADLILSTDTERVVVQAKRWSNAVGVAAVQAAHAATTYYKADRAILVTSAGFTRAARELADRTDVDLWDRERLVDALFDTDVGIGIDPSLLTP